MILPLAQTRFIKLGRPTRPSQRFRDKMCRFLLSTSALQRDPSWQFRDCAQHDVRMRRKLSPRRRPCQHPDTPHTSSTTRIEIMHAVANHDARDGDATRRAERMISRMDENGDGELQADEMTRRGLDAERMLSHADTDDDGEISEEEFDAAVEKRGDRGHKGRG